MKLVSFTTFALSILLQSSSSVASLRKPHQLLNREQANDQDQNVYKKQSLQELQKHHETSRNTHRMTEEVNIANSNALIQFLECEECAYLVDRINDMTEEFLNGNDDEEIVEQLCSDVEAGQILRMETKMEKGLDPDAPFATCESALNTLLVQQKETLFWTISDLTICKAEVRRVLDTFKDEEGSRHRTLRRSSSGRHLGRYIIINKAVTNMDFIRRAMIIVKP